MKAILATGVAAAALAAAASMPASAECINGFETLGNNVIVLCESGPAQFGAMTDDGMLPEEQLVEGEEPLFTGSIPPAEAPEQLVDDNFVETPIEAAAVATEELVEEPIATATFGEPMLTASAEENEVPGQIPEEPFVATEVVMATSIDECRPGQFWMAKEVPVACPQQ